MAKSNQRFLMLVVIFSVLLASSAIAQDTYEDAAKKADEIHKTVATNVIYTEQELKALYYQNVQIIELLKEIRELLRQGLEKQENE